MRISDWSSDVCSSDLTITITADGTTTIPFIYAPAVFYPGTMKTSAITMLRHTFVEDCTLPANCDGSQGGGEADATTTTVYKIQRSLAATPDSFVDIGADRKSTRLNSSH